MDMTVEFKSAFASILCAAILATMSCETSFAVPTPSMTVVPLHSAGAKAVYPRLIRFPDAKVMSRVNAALAAKEKQARTEYADCLSDLKEASQKPDKDSYWVEVDVVYLSSRYLSIQTNTSENCGGPHPNFGELSPIAFDLSTGSELVWGKLFKPGFLPTESSDGTANSRPSILSKLYRKHYPWTVADTAKFKRQVAKGLVDESDNCREVVDGQDPFEFSDEVVLWLQSEKGLVVSPVMPHAVQACAEEVVLPVDEIAPYLKDLNLVSELRAIRKAEPQKAHK
ncbi:MAG: hypothetical protein HY243_08055 [Proteobacteria bacterium]|nr:hypothetical protein [Pseudomonadota bacterium]